MHFAMEEKLLLRGVHEEARFRNLSHSFSTMTKEMLGKKNISFPE